MGGEKKMEKIDMEQASLQDIIKAIDYCNTTYGKEYDIYTYYHYDNDNIVGVVYGWLRNNYLFIDIVFVKSEYRGKGIATSMLENVMQEIRYKNIDSIIIELVQYKGKYLLTNILARLGFSLSPYYYLQNRHIFFKPLKI